MTRDAVQAPVCILQEKAWAIADMPVERRLAACVQIMPVESVHRWDGP